MLILEDLIEAEIDIWEERAAIREFDGNMPRKDAERMALKDIEKRRKRNGSEGGLFPSWFQTDIKYRCRREYQREHAPERCREDGIERH